eukprot:10129277-Lingulodinium_polyedra.AAC.1
MRRGAMPRAAHRRLAGCCALLSNASSMPAWPRSAQLAGRATSSNGSVRTRSRPRCSQSRRPWRL